ncbi:MAG: transposase, partial [Rhodobacteraceae bacterium]|nr:transposase [Paracoccaceae bacterium]
SGRQLESEPALQGNPQDSLSSGLALGGVPTKGSQVGVGLIHWSQREQFMTRHDLTDAEWAIIEPLLPNKPRGVPRVDDRRVINGILWRFRSGARWRDVPERYGPRTTRLTNASCVGTRPACGSVFLRFYQ